MGSRFASTSNNARELLLHYDGVVDHLRLYENNQRAMKLLKNLEDNKILILLDASFMFLLWNAFISPLWTRVSKPVVQRKAVELAYDYERKLLLLKDRPVANLLAWVRVEAEAETSKLKGSKYMVLISKFEKLWNSTSFYEKEKAMHRFKGAITFVLGKFQKDFATITNRGMEMQNIVITLSNQRQESVFGHLKFSESKFFNMKTSNVCSLALS